MGPMGAGLLAGIGSGIAGGIGDIITAGMQDAFGMNEMQAKNQNRLNRDAAEIALEFGDKAAEHSTRLQRKTYVDYLSPEKQIASQVRGLEKEGLNVGLMYGGSGPAGSGSASTAPQTPMNPTPGRAPSATEMAMAAANQRAIGMNLMRQQAEIENIKADTERKKAETPKIEQETEIARITVAEKAQAIQKTKQETDNLVQQNKLTKEQAEIIQKNYELAVNGLNEEIRHNTAIETNQQNTILESVRHNGVAEAVAWYEAVTGRTVGTAQATKATAEAKEAAYNITKGVNTGTIQKITMSRDAALKIGIDIGKKSNQEITVWTFVDEQGGTRREYFWNADNIQVVEN